MASTGKENVQEELKRYLDEKQLNTLFIAIVETLLLDKPDEPISFIVQYLKDKFPSETLLLFQSRDEKRGSFEEHSSDVDGTASESDSDSYESDEEEHEPITPRLRPTRRASVCAEKLCAEKVGSEVVKNIPKTEEEFEKIHTILMKCVLFEHLDESQLQTVKEAMFPVTKEEDAVIIEQGDDGDNFYIIESGSVDVFIDGDSENSPALVNSYDSGDSFGELAIMYNAPRAATCIAKGGQVKLWALDRVSFKVILMKAAISKRNQYKSFLKEVPILSGLNEHEILTIADALHEESYEDGKVIFEEGAEGDGFYIVKEGSVICTKMEGDGCFRIVAHLQSGAYFGEIALMSASGIRQATVTASGPTECLWLDRKTFKRLLTKTLEEKLVNSLSSE